MCISILLNILLVFFVWSGVAFGACGGSSPNLVAASCEEDDVQDCVDAAIDGDTITVPSGDCTWTTAVLIDDIEIYIIAAGIGNTNVTDSEAGADGHAFETDNDSDKNIRISGFTFIQGVTHTDGTIKIGGSGDNWRIDNCDFTNSGGSSEAIHVGNNESDFPFGLIDNCVFHSSGSTSKSVQIVARQSDDASIPGDAAWAEGISLGTANAVFIEDCYFYFNPRYVLSDLDEGGRLVFRYNHVYGAGLGSHGHDGGYQHRGMFTMEVYESTFDSNGTQMWAAIAFRGGTGVIFNCTFSGNYSDTIMLYCYCGCDPQVTCTAWPLCTYPCPDQVGRTTSQVLYPLRAWNNTYNDGLDGVDTFNNNGDCDEIDLLLVEDRDWFESSDASDALEGYTPYPYPHPLRGESSSTLSGCTISAGGGIQ